MNAVLLERQLIEARIHADALNRTAEQLKALEASLRSEEIDRIIEEIYGDPSDTGRLLGRRADYSSLRLTFRYRTPDKRNY